MKIDGKMETQGAVDFSDISSPKMAALNCDGPLIDGAIENETESETESKVENVTGVKKTEKLVNSVEEIDVQMESKNCENESETASKTKDKSNGSVPIAIETEAKSDDVISSDMTSVRSTESPSKSKISDGLILVASTDHPLAKLDRQMSLDRQSSVDAPSPEQTETGKGKRRVRFQGDENDVVASYHDAPNPWKNSKKFTPAELVSAYKIACFQSGLKPIHKLILQLEATPDIGERFETLTIKGERLTLKHCDALEEIFRRVQFKTVDLEASDLDDDSAGSIFDMIEFYNSATRLVLAYNKSIGPRGWQACGRMLKRTPSLEHLDLRSCSINDHSMPFIGRALRVGSNLQILHLENSGISAKVLLILVAALKLNENLKELYLADNRLMPSDGIQLGNLLKHNDRIQLVDLRNNHLQDTGVSHICDGLEVHDQPGFGLTTLVLWNNQLTQNSMNKMAHALVCNRNLETLNLGHNNIGNEGILLLKEGLLKNKSLKRLGLQCCRLFCEGAIAVAELVADSNRLLRVDLRENEIKTAGLMALSLSLKMNQSVTRLDLDKEIKKERAVKDYLEQQSCLLSDISNWLQRNREHAYCVEQVQKTDNAVKEDVPEQIEPVEEKADSPVEEKPDSADTEKSPPSRPKGSLHLSLQSRSESLESPMVAPEDLQRAFEEEMASDDYVTSEDGMTSEDYMTSSDELTSTGDMTSHVSSTDDMASHVTSTGDMTSHVTSPGDMTSHVTSPGDMTSHVTSPGVAGRLTRHGGRMFSVKYVPENSLSDSEKSFFATPGEAIVSPTLEFPLSLDPGERVLPILVPVDVSQPRPQLLPVDQHGEKEEKSEDGNTSAEGETGNDDSPALSESENKDLNESETTPGVQIPDELFENSENSDTIRNSETSQNPDSSQNVISAPTS